MWSVSLVTLMLLIGYSVIDGCFQLPLWMTLIIHNPLLDYPIAESCLQIENHFFSPEKPRLFVLLLDLYEIAKLHSAFVLYYLCETRTYLQLYDRCGNFRCKLVCCSFSRYYRNNIRGIGFCCLLQIRYL